MTARRRLLAAASATLSLAALAACEKPAPIVTVVNDGSSVYAEANTYCFEGQSVQDNSCATRGTGMTKLAYDSAQPVGIDVAKPLADRGWYYELRDPASGQVGYTSLPQTGHYAVAPGVTPGTTFDLVVLIGTPPPPTPEGAPPAPEQPSEGVWQFHLVPR